MVRASGAPALALAISMREGGNIITLGEIDHKVGHFALDDVRLERDDVELDPIGYTDCNRASSSLTPALQAVGIVLAIMLLFLGLRTGLVVASLVPTAMIMALLVMSFLGIGLDQMSLAALIISLGLLVDNSIVMAESILVQITEGKPRLDAAVDSARELRGPLFISSLTTAAAFLPFFLSESDTGEYTAPLFKVVTITLLSSWLLALTLTPLLAVLFLKVKSSATEESFNTFFYRWYRRTLLAGLRHRSASLVGVVVVFVLAMQGFAFVPKIFFPPSDKAIFTIEYELPSGTSIERTTEVVAAVDRFVRDELTVGDERVAGVTNWATFIGNGGPRFYLSHNPKPASPNYALAIVNATSRAVITDEVIPRLEAFCAEEFPDLEAKLNPLQLGPPVVAPIQVRLSGRDEDTLFDIVDTVKARLRGIPGTKNIGDDWGVRGKKLMIDVDQPRARRAGVTNQDIAISLQTALSGFETTQYREGDEIIPVTLRSSAASRTDLSKLESLNVYAQATGRSVPLSQVADTRVVWEPAQVLRRNRLKTVTVSSELEAGVTATQVVAELRPWLAAEEEAWPLGYLSEFGGEEESSVRANQAIGEKMPIGGLIILLLLVFQFNSVRRTAIILLTIPLGLIGVVIGLLVANSYFGFMTLLGIIALAGIVINNAIVLIDRIGIERDQNGLDPPRAIIEAAQRRFRPILLTTATTIAGLLPLWFGGGPMYEPMAITIIFGLLFATLLTLGVVPILYSVFFRVKFKGFAY